MGTRPDRCGLEGMADFERERRRMVERQIAGRGIRDPRLLDALRSVPRELFVAADLADSAYEDSPLPIEAEQTISQPFIVAAMIAAAQVSPGSRVLEIGAGSGYAAAVIGRIAGEVIAIERHSQLADLAGERMRRLGYDNVTIIHGDGSAGWPDKAPYDAILAAASGSHIPDVLKEQLAIGGILVMPVGDPHEVQRLIKVQRTAPYTYREEDLGAVRFVPLIEGSPPNQAGTSAR